MKYDLSTFYLYELVHLRDRRVDTCRAFFLYISRAVELDIKSILVSHVRIIELSQVLLSKIELCPFFKIHVVFLAFPELGW